MASGAIRYNYSKEVWEFSNDRSNYNEFSPKDHNHVSSQITDATSNAISNAIVRRGPSAEAYFGRVHVNTALYADTYASMGKANSIQDPEQTTVTNFTITGTSSNFKMTVQDGGGKINFLWNATKGGNGRYLTSSEAAFRMQVDTGEQMSRAAFGIYSAQAGIANQDIVWRRDLYIEDGVVTFGTQNDPHGTIKTNGDVTWRGTVYAKGFETQSRSEWKENITIYDDNALDVLNAVNVYRFTYRSDEKHQQHIGILADEVSNPDLSGENQDKFDITNTVAVLIKAVQELTARIEKLEA